MDESGGDDGGCGGDGSSDNGAGAADVNDGDNVMAVVVMNM